MKQRRPRQTSIIGYHGGNFPGCFCEPNFALFLKDNPSGEEVCDIYSSGHDGLFSGPYKDQPLSYQRQRATEEFLAGKLDTVQVYPATQRGIARMLKAYRNDFIVGVVKVLEQQYNIVLPLTCQQCGATFHHDDGYYFSSERGDGGIGIVRDELQCPDCHARGDCPMCRENTTERDLEEHYGICQDCFDKEEVQDAIEKRITDLERLALDVEAMKRLRPAKAAKFEQQGQQLTRRLEGKIRRKIDDLIG